MLDESTSTATIPAGRSQKSCASLVGYAHVHSASATPSRGWLFCSTHIPVCSCSERTPIKMLTSETWQNWTRRRFRWRRCGRSSPLRGQNPTRPRPRPGVNVCIYVITHVSFVDMSLYSNKCPSMKERENYSVELTGPGLNLKRELTETNAHELLIWLLKGGKLQATGQGVVPSGMIHSPPAATTGATSNTQSASGALMSVREFMEQYEPKRVPDKIACFGLYLRAHRNQKEFSKTDVVSLFQEAADPLPKNLGRDLRWTQSIAWIAPSPSNRENFYVTKKGEDAILNRFPKEMLAKTRLSPAPQRRRSNGEDSKDVNASDDPGSSS